MATRKLTTGAVVPGDTWVDLVDEEIEGAWRHTVNRLINPAGTATAYAAVGFPVFAADTLVFGTVVVLVPHLTCGASPTLNIDGLGAKPLVKPDGTSDGTPMLAGDMVAWNPYTFEFRDTYYFLLTTAGSSFEGTAQAEFDALEAEIIAARSGSASLDERIDGIATTAGNAATDAEFTVLQAEVVAARSGEASLDARIDSIASGAAFDFDEFETEIDARLDAVEAAAAAEEAARIATDAIARAELLTEPAVSELASLWSATVVGEPKDRAEIDASEIVFDGTDGLILRVTGASERAPRAAYRGVLGHKYEVLAMARRAVNPTDPLGDAVSLRVAWLSAAKAVIDYDDLEISALPASTLKIYRKIVSLSAGAEVDVVASAGTVYFTPFVQTYGSDGVTNIIPYIRVTDLTSNTLVSADVSGLDARLSALESADLDTRLTVVEGLVAGSEIARFPTRALAVSAATAGTIPAGVDVLEVLGLTAVGDDVVEPYQRQVSDPGGGDRFVDDDGSWWVGRAQGLQRVDGMVALRYMPPVNGRAIHLTYHTTVGDLGAGLFRGVTGAAPATYVDNDGTIIVPAGGNGSAAWLRVWNGVTAHVGWFGARCTPSDVGHDDYPAVKKCLDMFTNGRTAAGFLTGVMLVGPGFCFSKPLIYGGNNGKAIIIRGEAARSRGGQEVSLLRYIGPSSPLGAVTFYAASESTIEYVDIWPGGTDINYVLTTPGCWNALAIVTDNTFNSSISAPVTAGTNVTLSITTIGTWLQVGSYMGLDAGGANFEIVYITGVNLGASTITVRECLYNHAALAQLGGGAASSGCRVNRVRHLVPPSPFNTTLSINSTVGAGTSERTFTPVSMTGIELGMPVRLGNFANSETVYVLSITATTFNAVSLYQHLTGDRVILCTAGVMIGNRLVGTVQLSEVVFRDCGFTALTGNGISYAGIRQPRGGNTKNFSFYDTAITYVQYGYAGEDSSGHYLFSGITSAQVSDTMFLVGTATLTVIGWEDESFCYWLRGGGGSSPCQATFIGCTAQGAAPETNDQMIVYSGELTWIGSRLSNNRVANTSLPIIVVPGIRSSTVPGSLFLSTCHINNALADSGFVTDVPAPGGGGIDIIADGTAKFTMFGCVGGPPGSVTRLPAIFPPQIRWQNTATYDPPSLAAGAVDTIQTMTISGAVLGDLVEASFSLDLQGIALRAWVSATNAVKYQFSCPAGGATVNLASGTVKCRLKK